MMILPMLFFPFFHFHSIFLLVLLFLYFLPAYLARNKANFAAILAVNLLAGWTFIGWIVALIWALSAEPQRRAGAPAQPAGASSQAASSGGFFCTACGKPCMAGARFCTSCGAALPSTQR